MFNKCLFNGLIHLAFGTMRNKPELKKNYAELIIFFLTIPIYSFSIFITRRPLFILVVLLLRFIENVN